ncbi:MAG: GFA family protein [Pseudomonadota bacterium]
MTQDDLTGSCLCGAVTFSIADSFELFHLCHCLQCRKTTGTAHASNLFTTPDNIRWHTGEDVLARYDVEGRTISNVFCNRCGSRMPYLSLSGKALVVPAGSLDQTPSLEPIANIFWPERAAWYEAAMAAPTFVEFAD